MVNDTHTRRRPGPRRPQPGRLRFGHILRYCARYNSTYYYYYFFLVACHTVLYVGRLTVTCGMCIVLPAVSLMIVAKRMKQSGCCLAQTLRICSMSPPPPPPDEAFSLGYLHFVHPKYSRMHHLAFKLSNILRG